ncbi:multidrug and toxin extrusion protein 1-like [Convolutriloba macropyga]|uniref:multidrug and toxin extrusion protein 1-like n=1 Tax=Convolutriloba macropyga TaxID=536237 RepID=UPI003F52736B
MHAHVHDSHDSSEEHSSSRVSSGFSEYENKLREDILVTARRSDPPVVNVDTPSRLGTEMNTPASGSIFLKELRVLFFLSWPICLSSFLEQTLFQLVASIFCGHSSSSVYAAFVAATSFGNIVGTAVILGLSAAVDTLFAQYHGGEHFKEMGFVLQKSVLIILPYAMGCTGLYLISDWILIALHFDVETAVLTGLFLKIYTISIPAEVLSIVLGKFLQCQGHVKASVVANIIANAINAVLCYLLIYVWDGGIVGVSLALAISLTSLAVVYYCIIIYYDLHKKTWPGFHWSVVYGWTPYIKLAIPGTIMVVSDMVIFEIGSVLAGMIDSHNLSVQGILYEFSTCLFMWGIGVAYAASIRVGNLLGAGDFRTARRTVICSIVLSCTVSIMLSALVFIFKDSLAYLIISEDAVASHFSLLVPYLSWCSITDCIVAVCIGILSGCGRQFVGAVGTFVNYYIITLPLSLCLMFLTDLKLQGYWLGLCIGSSIQAFILVIAIYKLDWNKEVKLAQKRSDNDCIRKPDRVLSNYSLIKPSRAGSALSLAKFSQDRLKYQSSVQLSNPLGSNNNLKVVSDKEHPFETNGSLSVINSNIASVSSPELYKPLPLVDESEDLPDEMFESTKVAFEDVIQIKHSSDVRESELPPQQPNRPNFVTQTSRDFFARYVSFVSFQCQCLKLLYYFMGFTVLLAGLFVSVAFPVKDHL